MKMYVKHELLQIRQKLRLPLKLNSLAVLCCGKLQSLSPLSDYPSQSLPPRPKVSEGDGKPVMETWWVLACDAGLRHEHLGADQQAQARTDG